MRPGDVALFAVAPPRLLHSCQKRPINTDINVVAAKRVKVLKAICIPFLFCYYNYIVLILCRVALVRSLHKSWTVIVLSLSPYTPQSDRRRRRRRHRRARPPRHGGRGGSGQEGAGREDGDHTGRHVPRPHRPGIHQVII